MDDDDTDRGLQVERTELGWWRTGLAAAGLTGVFLRARIDGLDEVAAAAIALSAAVVIAIVVVVLRLPARRDGRIAGFVTALVAVIAVIQLAAVALD